MAIIRLDQTGYAANTVRNRSTEALQSWGEQAIHLHTYSSAIDEGDLPRCPNCWDEIYKQSEYDCQICFGTSYDPPFKRISRVWAIFENTDKRQSTDKRGEFIADKRQVSLEGWVNTVPGDFLIRVKKWDSEHRPIELGGRYVLGDITESNLRTGTKYGQEPSDRIGQKTSVSFLDRSHPIYRFPIKSDTPIQRYDDQWYGAEI